MIYFNVENCELYNYILHHFLEIEVFESETDIGDTIEEIFPKYLYRE